MFDVSPTGDLCDVTKGQNPAVCIQRPMESVHTYVVRYVYICIYTGFMDGRVNVCLAA